MAKRYYEKDGDLSRLQGKTVAIIGYGSQGHAHALNLRDQRRERHRRPAPGSKSAAKATAAGLKVLSVADATKGADIAMILVPDHIQGDLYQNDIAPHLTRGQDADVRARLQHSLRRNQAAGGRGRFDDRAQGARPSRARAFTEGVGVPALVAVHQDPSGNALQNALAYALALGCLKAGVIETTFKEETESDLFGEQAVLCGGVSELIRAGFETLVEAGYAPEIAYFECLHELKLIVDLIYEGGLSYMRYSVSDTAEYGDYTRGPRIVNERDARGDEEDSVARFSPASSPANGSARTRPAARSSSPCAKRRTNQPIEKVGAELRKMMTFLEEEEGGRRTARARSRGGQVAHALCVRGRILCAFTLSIPRCATARRARPSHSPSTTN